MNTSSNDGQSFVTVAQTGAPRRLSEGLWEVAFRVANAGDAPLTLVAAWLPHGRFRCGEQSLEAEPPLAPAGERTLVFPVAFHETPGTAVENAFVILRLQRQGETWRVLVRLTTTAREDGAPYAKTELISAHPVGFSR